VGNHYDRPNHHNDSQRDRHSSLSRVYQERCGRIGEEIYGGSHSQAGAIARANLESAEGETSGSGAGDGIGEGGGARGT
jgi:hypothetical protein